MMDLWSLIWWLIELIFMPQIFIPLIYPGLVAVLVILLTIIWLERKIAAKIQLRYGPLYVSKPIGGALQLLADALRFLFQEIIVPVDADKVVFLVVPVLSMLIALTPIVFIPPYPGVYAVKVEYNLLMVLALGSITPITLIAIAWAANNKFTIIGGLREAFMTIAYEASLMLATLSMAILYGSLSIEEIIYAQKIPGILLNPLAAIVFFVAMLMSSGKLPFDIVEGEQEIVAGPFTEYTGIIYGLMMGVGYIQLYALSMLFVILFLGGWYPLIPWLAEIYKPLGGIMLFIKTYLVIVFSVFLRSVYGRYRLDQAIEIGWRKLLLLAIISIPLSFAVGVLV